VLHLFYNAKILAVNASLGWLNKVSGLILSGPLIKGRLPYILTTKNEELLAASALFVSHNGFINFFAIVYYI
jgi:hypothetical protein